MPPVITLPPVVILLNTCLFSGSPILFRNYGVSMTVPFSPEDKSHKNVTKRKRVVIPAPRLVNSSMASSIVYPPKPHQPRHFPFPKKVWEKPF